MYIMIFSRLEEDKKSDEAQAKFSAKALFQTKDRTGQSEVADTVLNTTHQNQIRLAFLNVWREPSRLTWKTYTKNTSEIEPLGADHTFDLNCVLF
jgi:hypothetical protein